MIAQTVLLHFLCLYVPILEAPIVVINALLQSDCNPSDSAYAATCVNTTETVIVRSTELIQCNTKEPFRKSLFVWFMNDSEFFTPGSSECGPFPQFLGTDLKIMAATHICATKPAESINAPLQP